MKRRLCFLLALVMLLSALPGCGAGKEETAQAAPETAAAETAAATEGAAEPTLSPEEELYNSLSEKVRKACDLGIVELGMLDDMERVCTGAEAAAMLQKARSLKRGAESLLLSQVEDSIHADLEVTRFWMVQMMYFSELEQFMPPVYEDYLENLRYMNGDIPNAYPQEASDYFYNQRTGWVVSENYGIASHTNRNQMGKPNKWAAEDTVLAHGYITLIKGFLDGSEMCKDKPEEWAKYVDYGSPFAMEWALRTYDATTGEKLMPWDENMETFPRQKVSVQEAVETALRYYNYIPEDAQMLAFVDVPFYDREIITEELLKRETTLPQVSCQQLPSQWRGVAMKDLLFIDNGDFGAKTDMMIHENEIQLIKDAGFNYVRILFDFNYFMHTDDNFFYGPMNAKKKNTQTMNETHLKELDKIIACCMERDIHVNLVCADVAGWFDGPDPNAPLAKSANAKPMAEQWRVLAQRYAEIPNTYLSFTLFNNPSFHMESSYQAFFAPVVEAIREVSPNRCLIAEITGRCTGESMAQLGVALSSSARWPGDLFISGGTSDQQMKALFDKMTWPYETGGTVYDGEGAMVNRTSGLAPDAVAAVAKQYGVGYMVNEWSAIGQARSVLRERFSDEMLQAYLTDMSMVMAEREYGWCYGDWFSFVGIGAAYPAVRTTTYTRLNDAPLYVDNETFAWFREINGVS